MVRFITRRIKLEVWHTLEITWLQRHVAQELTQMMQINGDTDSNDDNNGDEYDDYDWWG